MRIKRNMISVVFLMSITPAIFAQPSAFQPIPEEPAGEEAGASEVPETPAPEPVVELTLRERIAGLMLVTLEGRNAPTASDARFIKKYTPAGVVVARALKPGTAADYVQQLQGLRRVAGRPMLIAADLYRLRQPERGNVTGFHPLPTPLGLCAAGDSDTSEAAGEILSTYLKHMGFNCLLGPSLELASELPSCEGSIYRMGSDPATAASIGKALVQTITENQLITVPMGFPGGGANRPPKMPPALLTLPEELPAHDLMPYAAVIEAGVPMIHVGPTLVPTLESVGKPACLSRRVMEELLRADLRFSGVVLAGPLDGIDMARNFDPAEAAIEALNNGADMLYWLGTNTQVLRTIDRLTTAVEAGRVSEVTINAAWNRVQALLASDAVLKQPPVDVDKAGKFQQQSDLLNSLVEIDRTTFTLLKNSQDMLPLSKEASMPLGITGVVGVETLHEALKRHLKQIAQQPITSAQHLGEIQDFEIYRITRKIAGARTIIVLFSDSVRTAGKVALIRGIQEKGARVVAVALGYPKDIDQLMVSDAVIAGYCDPDSSEIAMTALGDILVGRSPVTLKALPSGLQLTAGQERRFDVAEIAQIPPGTFPLNVFSAIPQGAAVTMNAPEALKKITWDFGNGDTLKKPSVSYAYPQAGTYTLTVDVVSVFGDTSQQTYPVTVESISE